MKIEMLSTGDEVLYGQITDTNAVWLADTLFAQGLAMTHRSTVGDALSDLVEELQQRSQVADVLIVNGGLGPTSDDLSAQAAALACGVPLVRDEEWLGRIEAFFSQRGQVMAVQNRKQADIPQYGERLDNRIGTACGFCVTLNQCQIFFTPGVPSEFKVMVTEQILPRLKARFTLPSPPCCLRLTTFGRGESSLAALLEPLILPEQVVIGYRAAMPVVEIKLTGPQSAQVAMQGVWQQIREQVAEWIIFEGTDGLPAALGVALRDNHARLAVSETVTGGLLHWQLASANVPLAGGECPVIAEESLPQLMARSRALAELQQTQWVLVVGGHDPREPSICLITPQQQVAQQLVFTSDRHSPQLRQELLCTLAMTMLQRAIQGRSLPQTPGWLEVREQILNDR